jgi:hypothetical protein
MPTTPRRATDVAATLCLIALLSTTATACGPEAAQGIMEAAFGFYGTVLAGLLGLILLLAQIPPA